jgi:hypothetical protein
MSEIPMAFDVWKFRRRNIPLCTPEGIFTKSDGWALLVSAMSRGKREKG